MNIVHIVQLYHPVSTGSARLFEEIGARLVAEGHRVTVVATDAYDLEHFWMAGKRRAEPPEEWHRGVRIVRLPVHRLPGPPILYPILRRLMAECSRFPGTTKVLHHMATWTPQLPGLLPFLRAQAPIDLIHATNITLDFAIVPAYHFAQQHSIPFFCTPLMHLGVPGDDSLARYYSMHHQLDILRHSQRVLTMTNIESDYLASRGVSRDRLVRIGVGVSPQEVAGGDGDRFRREQALHGPIVLGIGAMARDKGTIDLVEAMRHLWKQGVHATLVLIGAPLEHFLTYHKALPVSEQARIRLLAYAPEQTKRDALAAATLVALPSRTDSFGIVFLEAWLYDLPVVGARAGGIPDVIADGRDGLLVPFGDVPSLTATLQRLLDHPELAQRLGKAGKAKVLRDYTWDRIYERVRTVYSRVQGLGVQDLGI